jgi:hypothetical protein
MSEDAYLEWLWPDGERPRDGCSGCHESSWPRFREVQSPCIFFSELDERLDLFFSSSNTKLITICSSLIAMSVIAEPKLFGKWTYEDVQCTDLSLKVC